MPPASQPSPTIEPIMKMTQSLLLAAIVAALAGIPAQAQFQPRLQAIINRAPDASANTDAESQKLSGTVTDAAGQPIAGATVEYWQNAGSVVQASGLELNGQTNTDARGAFELDVSRGTGFLLARKPGLAPAWKLSGQPFNPVGETETKLVLTPPGTLAGTVVDESSQPVAHAEVFVTLAVIDVSGANGSRSFNMLSGEPARDCFSARTDAAGRFRIDNFPTNATAMLAVRSPGKAMSEQPGSFTGLNSLPWSADQEDIKLAVEPAGGVEGKIICEATNLPLPIARVSLQPEIQRGFGFATPEPVSSSPDGSFRITDVASGSYSVRAVFGTNAPADWVAEPASISVEPGQTNRDVQLTAVRGGVLAVSVVGKEDGKPLSRVNVNVYRQSYQAAAVSGPDGIAWLRLLPGDYQVTALRGGSFVPGNQTSASVDAGQTNRVEIELVGPRKVSGIVRAPDGQPAAGVPVQIVGAFGLQGPDVKTDANGKFQLEWNQPQYGGQPEATACVLARDADHNLAVAQDLDEDTGTLDLKLAPGLTLAGKVEAGGNPATNVNASLVFWTGNRGMWLQGLARTNTPGQYEIPALPPGRRYGVMVSAPGYGQRQLQNLDISADPGRQELDPVELKPANLKLAGQVLDANDKPVAGANVQLNGPDQPFANMRTDRNGNFTFEHVCEGTVQLMANGQGSFGNISAEGGDTNVVLRLGQNFGSAPGAITHKLKGVVSDAAGQPVAGAQIAVFPNFGGTHWFKSGTNGAFSLTWSLQPWQMQSGTSLLVVRDPARDLAVTEDLSEDVTNLQVKLEPALTVTGQVIGMGDAPLTNAQVELMLRAGNMFSPLDAQPTRADAEGRFDIKCLPPEARYTVYASAKGYGRSQQQVESDTETNRLELTPFVLKLADRVIAGQVLDANDKPISGVNVQLNGTDQPNGNMTTDSQGRFHFQVCEGRINLFANSQYGGGFAQAAAEAGDTNIVMNLRANMGGFPQPPRRASLKGNPLPDLTTVNLAADAAPAGKAVLLCLFDAAQRPSRHVINQLNDQAAALQQKNVSVLGVQATVASDEVFNDWKTASPVSFPVGRVTERSPKSRWASEAAALPWLILADANHRVIAEGFALDELDAQIQKLTP